jgi:hypothetical protein
VPPPPLHAHRTRTAHRTHCAKEDRPQPHPHPQLLRTLHPTICIPVQDKRCAYGSARGLPETSDGADSDDSIKDNKTERALRRGRINEKRGRVALATTLTHAPCLPHSPCLPPPPPTPRASPPPPPTPPPPPPYSSEAQARVEEEGSGSTVPKRSVEKGSARSSKRDGGREDSEDSGRDSLLTDEARASYLP